MKVAENFFTSINNKVICKETEVTVTFEQIKPDDVLMVNVTSLSITGTTTTIAIQHQSQTYAGLSF